MQKRNQYFFWHAIITNYKNVYISRSRRSIELRAKSYGKNKVVKTTERPPVTIGFFILLL